ncbi:hypothetical protein [Sporosarcina quadrami]|nr:hypothetical protein [Sporosarcina quadrami]
MKKWFIGILVIVFILSSQIGIKENTDDEEKLPGMSEEIDGSV